MSTSVQGRAWRCARVALLVLAMLPSVPLAAPVAGGFAYARAPYQFVFPRDHASHPEYRTEWWYFTGHLRAKDGRRFGYELTFFRYGLRPGDPQPKPDQSRWRGNELFPAHFAITDEAGQRFVHVERIAREALGEGAAATTHLDVRSGSWTLIGSPLQDLALERMHLHAAAGDNAIDLVQLPLKPPAVHGSGGISRKSACESCASHYYSYTRLQTIGTLTYGGVPLAVVGISWMDHEFGSSELAPEQTGWDWFSLQLNDGRDVMLYRLRERDGRVTPQSSGSVIDRHALVHALRLADFSIESQSQWRSPHTGGRYPSGWRVRIPGQRLDLVLTPTVADQELANSSGTSYWEGAVTISTSTGASLGVGYVELTGYASPVRL
jgi:predicted secreted hydrolase